MKQSILIAFLLCFSTIVNAQSIQTAKAQQAEYMKSLNSNGETAFGYDALYLSYQEYLKVLNDNSQSYETKQQAIDGLSEIFLHLKRGAYYYTGQNNAQNAQMFAEAYLDLSALEQLQETKLAIEADHATLAYFAASNNYNARKYDKAIKYLEIYIKSGDTKKLKEAFNFLGKSYIYQKDNSYAIQILQAGLNLFPNDLALLTTTINLLAETKSDDAALKQYVSQAIILKPTDEGLQNIQAQLYERNKQFELAVECYRRLRQAKPNSLEIARHLAINLYNNGVELLGNNKKTAANQRFTEAANILNEVLASDPLATNYTYALASAYSALNDKKGLERMNERLVALGRAPVDNNSALAFVDAVPVRSTVPAPSLPARNNNIQLPERNNQDIAAANPYSQSKAANTVASKPAMPLSDVDKDIPETGIENGNTYAVIIANGQYQKVANVGNAENDGKMFAEYCSKVLGLPNDNIMTYHDATYGVLLSAIDKIKKIAKVTHGDLNVIFYYAGHGIPNEETKTGYILPVDADGKIIEACYSLRKLYDDLASLNAKNTVVFMDACFSGARRSSDNEMLLSARSVAIDVDEDEIEGKVVVFSAATGNQTALSYDEKYHGMFTYYLLKKLKETKGKIDLGALSDYISESVSKQSLLKNDKLQTPTVITGNGYESSGWRHLKLAQ